MKLNGKRLAGIIGLLPALVAVALLPSCGKGKPSEVQYVPVQVTEGGAWAFINEKGERIGNQEWEFEPTVTRDNMFTARTDSGLTVYRWDGDVAKPVDSLVNLASVGVYNEGLMPVTPLMERIRIVDGKGKLKFTLDPINGQEISSCASKFSEGRLVFTTYDGKCGVLDNKGNVIVPPKYSEITNYSGGFAFAANYDYDNYEKGPEYFIIDLEGNATPVKGTFGYGVEEGDCGMVLSPFHDNLTDVYGPTDTVNYTAPLLLVNVEGKVESAGKDVTGIQWLDNGSRILFEFVDDKSSSVWRDSEGKIVMKTFDSGYMTALGKYVYLHDENKNVLYNELGKEIISFKDERPSVIWPGGPFGPAVVTYNEDYSSSTVQLYDAEGQIIQGAKYYGIGVTDFISLVEDEIMCQELVTSAYVDVTAAASKLAGMINGVKGKENYYIGQSIADILKGENARFYSGGGRSITIPTDSTGNLGSGAGFWLSGSALSTTDIVAPTYQQYFEVHHYDYWGNAWGWNRKRQVGVHFNSSAQVKRFDIQLHTNHPSGTALREAVGRRLKKDNYTQTRSTENFDEYNNGYSRVVVYGNRDSHGVGLVTGNDVDKLSEEEKSTLAATL